ncbi:2-oxo acid dehydrogenase subunit E2 [Candidatus Saccharibacteria bacterium]|nr:2-oxo acid dehydrogenase subunit E2 [Candidatus Saccharibacteria bacterium]
MSKRYGGAHRVKGVSGLNQISIDLKPHRSVSDVYINQKMDLTELVKYIEKKKAAGEEVTFFHAFLTAIGKTVYNRPKLNHFVADRHLWEHEKVVLSFVAKISFDDHSEEMMVMIPIEKDDTIYTIGDKVRKKVEAFRNKKANKVNKEGANSAIDILAKLPNFMRVPLIGVLKWTDKKGFLPSSLAKDNLYYSTMIVSNLGSIGCGAIFHNITDFGNSSSLLTMGEIKDEEIINGKKHEVRKICEWGMNFDERIADGYYFAKSAKVLQYLLSHPELLEKPASEKVEMPELR